MNVINTNSNQITKLKNYNKITQIIHKNIREIYCIKKDVINATNNQITLKKTNNIEMKIKNKPERNQ